MRRRAILRRFMLGSLAVLVAGCSESPSPRVSGVTLRVVAGGFEDDRVYGVGRVQFRSFDAEGFEAGSPPLSSEIVAVSRETGRFDVTLSIPAGTGRRILVEPLGSGILPNGGKTESGVALQGASRVFDLPAAGMVDLGDVVLFPYIPDDLRLEFVGTQDPFLAWRPMPPAATHTIRVIEYDESVNELVEREVPWDGPPRAPLSELSSGKLLFGLQVRSENRFASSAYSDTLFTEGTRVP